MPHHNHCGSGPLMSVVFSSFAQEDADVASNRPISEIRDIFS